MGLINIVEYEDILNSTTTYIKLENARFKEDFGPFKKDEIVRILTLNYATGMLTAHNGLVKIKECKVALIAHEENKTCHQD